MHPLACSFLDLVHVPARNHDRPTDIPCGPDHGVQSRIPVLCLRFRLATYVKAGLGPSVKLSELVSVFSPIRACNTELVGPFETV